MSGQVYVRGHVLYTLFRLEKQCGWLTSRPTLFWTPRLEPGAVASIEHTAYPRFKAVLSAQELQTLYAPTEEEREFVATSARTDPQHLTLLTLFTQEVDWDVIERHWHDMMQVVLSIQVGTVLPSMLLQKLGVYSRQSSLDKAFSELGRVERTLFLLESVSNATLRRHTGIAYRGSGRARETDQVSGFNRERHHVA
jgi:hypothetical protein